MSRVKLPFYLQIVAGMVIGILIGFIGIWLNAETFVTNWIEPFGKLFINFGLRLMSVSFGAILYYVVIQAVVSLLKIDTNYLKLLSALIVAAFLTVPYWKSKYFHKKKKAAAGKENAHA